MKFVAVLIIIIGAGLSAAGQESSEWKRFRSPGGHFSVLLPETPKSDSIPLTNASGITLLMNVFLIPGNDNDVATYGIVYIDSTADLDEGALDAARDGAIQRSKATLTSEKKITLNGYVGLQFEATKEVGTVQSRMFLVGHRLYLVTYAWSKKADQTLAAKNAAKYFDSFELDPPKN
jgi:hypothetical protein